jgi:hopene-associated glycosyltransferase HpnB
MLLLMLSVAAFAAWIGLAFARLPFWRPIPRLGAHDPLTDWPGVVAVIPARNEAATMGAVVRAHASARYAGDFRVLVVDDQSTDATAALAREARGDLNLAVIEAPPLGEGWTGKLNAVNAGLARGRDFAPDAKYVLLTDADIVLAPETLARLVAHAERSGTALVSLMARLDARGLWGGLLIPAFVYFFQKLYPFHRVNDIAKRDAAAAGGVMLVRRDALELVGGVAAIRAKLIDDCALAALLKKSGAKIWLGVAKDEAASLRDNRALAPIWSMVARSAFTQLDHSFLLLAGTIVGMTLLYLVPPAIALAAPLHGNAAAAILALGAWVLAAATYLPTERAYDHAPWKTVFLPVAALFYMMMTIASAVDHARGEGGRWKGRTYAALGAGRRRDARSRAADSA